MADSPLAPSLTPASAGSLASDVMMDPFRDLYVIFGLSLIFIVGDASVSPAFSQIAAALVLTPQQVSLILMIFTLPMIVAAPVLGILADRWGRKRILVPCLVLFGLAGVACSLVQSFEQLLVCRFLQGIGGATLGSLNLALLSERFPPERRTAALGLNSVVVSGGAITLPFLGGWLAGFSWRLPFLIAVVAFPVAALVIWVLRDSGSRPQQGILGTYGMLRHALSDRRILGLLIATTAVFALFFGVQLNYFPQMLGSRLGIPPLGIGLILSCQSVAVAITAAQLRWLSKRLDLTLMIRLGFGCFSLSMLSTWLLLTFAPEPIWMGIPAILFGIGGGMAFACIQSRLSALSPAHLLGTIMALYGTAMTLGQTVGPSVMNLAFSVGDMTGVFGFAAVLAAGILLIYSRVPDCL